MEFRTQYDKQAPIHSNAGSRVKVEYSARYDDDGRVVLEEVGRTNLYNEIQSHKDSVDIHVLLKQYRNGDTSVLQRRQGLFLDVTDFPDNYADALNQVADARDYFMSLPVEARAEFNHSFTEFLAQAARLDLSKLAENGVVVEADRKDEVVQGAQKEGTE